ncbi:MAG: hypothetical protein V1727_00680 [Candidatus Omnitrophota bacterium]
MPCLAFRFCVAEEDLFAYKDSGKRDPFIALVSEQGRYIAESGEMYSSNELRVSGILWDPEGKSSALINDQMVAEGETFYGFLIKEIRQDHVTVSRDGQDYTIWVIGEKEDHQ